MNPTLRSSIRRPARLALSLAAVAISIALMLILAGLERGVRREVTAYLEHAPGDLVIAQSGSGTFFASSSVLPRGSEEAAMAVPGVASVTPIVTQATYLELHGKQIFVFVIGYRPEQRSGPWELTEGREPRRGLEVVVDEALAREHGIEVGESLRIGLLAFPVVGLSRGASTWLASTAFMTLDGVRTLLRQADLTSFLLITPSPGANPGRLQTELQGLPDSDALLKSEVMAGDLKLFAPFFAPISLMTGIAFVVGALMIALIAYTDALEHRREYGALKAIGAPAAHLYRLAATQGLAVSTIGSLLGVALALGGAVLIEAARPQFTVAFSGAMLAFALAAGVGMSVAAALAPIRMIARLAPAEAFRRRGS